MLIMLLWMLRTLPLLLLEVLLMTIDDNRAGIAGGRTTDDAEETTIGLYRQLVAAAPDKK